MQYEAVNVLLSGIFPVWDNEVHTEEEIRKDSHRLAALVRAGAPIVDVSDVFRAASIEISYKDCSFGHSTVVDKNAWGYMIRPALDCQWKPPLPVAVFSLSVPGLQAMWSSRFDGGDQVKVGMLVDTDGEWAAFALANMQEAPSVFDALGIAAMSLASAKNAQWVESEPNRATRRRHPSVSGIRFRHIEIDMGKPKRKGEPHDAESHGVPWHHRRGHWAYYSPEKPLFGRAGAHGWYWRPYTEVGDKAHGEIVQDYTVRGNLPGVSA
jgi:hypothetical protein